MVHEEISLLNRLIQSSNKFEMVNLPAELITMGYTYKVYFFGKFIYKWPKTSCIKQTDI